jgi:hypothetical protein
MIKDFDALVNLVESELARTFGARSESPGNHYLWYCETSESAPGNVAIATEQPFNGWFVACKIRDDMTDADNMVNLHRLRILSTLPVLDVGYQYA